MKERYHTEQNFKLASQYVAYDASSGEVLLVHDVLQEPECSAESEETGVEVTRQLAGCAFEKRKVKVLRLPEGTRLKPGLCYRVDPCTEQLVQQSGGPTSREFLAQISKSGE